MNAAGRARRNATRSEKRQAALRRRREAALAPERARLAQEARRRRRHRILGGVGIVVALSLITLGVILAWPGDEPDLSLRGKKLASNAPAQTISATPATYRITYRAELATEAGYEEQVQVRRPFDVRYRLGDPGQIDTPLFDSVRTRTAKTESSSAGSPTQERVTPTRPPFSVRLDVMLPDLLEQGFFVRRERRQVLDTPCTVYRTGAEFEGSEVTRPSADTYADWCVSDDGLVLEEVVIGSGKVQLRTTATAVERDLALTDADFPVSTDATLLDDAGVKVFDLSTAATPTSPYWQPTTVPAGWTLSSRQRVEVTKADESTSGPAVTKTSWVDVYVRGDDFVAVRQGNAGEEPAAVELTNAVDVTVGRLGAAKLVYGAGGSELVVANTGGRFVQLAGTVPAASLRSFAEALALG